MVLLLAHLADAEGLFGWAATVTARQAGRSARGLLARVVVLSAVVTAVLSLDATVVLLTPVVLATAARMRVPARPHAYAAGHLANSASLLLPVSNLTNLLAFATTGLSFLHFTGLMRCPWLVAVAVEFLLLRALFRRDLAAEVGEPVTEAPRPPRLALRRRRPHRRRVRRSPRGSASPPSGRPLAGVLGARRAGGWPPGPPPRATWSARPTSRSRCSWSAWPSWSPPCCTRGWSRRSPRCCRRAAGCRRCWRWPAPPRCSPTW